MDSRTGAALLLVCCSTLASAQNEEPIPNLDFLEYLGEWENEEGDWIDPLLLVEQDMADSGEQVE